MQGPGVALTTDTTEQHRKNPVLGNIFVPVCIFIKKNKNVMPPFVCITGI